jgi:hypothetical protein
MNAKPATAGTTAPASDGMNTRRTGRPMARLFQPRLLQSFDITMPDGRQWRGSLLTSPSRSCGRRVQVHDAAGQLLFDSKDCFDLANAQNGLSLWLEEQMKLAEVPREMPFADEKLVSK